jgi:hypothetical protein
MAVGSLGTRLLVALFALSMVVNAVAAIVDLSVWAVPALIAGWYLADLVSGLVHMTMDYRPCPAGRGLSDLYFYEGSRESEEYRRMFRSRMATLGPIERLVYDFKNHHPRPDALGRRPIWRLIGASVMLGALPASLLLTLTWLAAGLPGWVMAGGVALIVGGAFAQYFHGTLHREANPAIIVAMRHAGLLMTREAHQRHHDTLKRDFSTNCGWSNPLLNRVFEIGRGRGYFRDEGLEPHS